MSRNALGLSVLIGLALAAFFQSRGGFFGREDVRSVKALAKAAAQVNQGLPKSVDEITELTRVDAEEGVLVYRYTLTRGTAADYDANAITSTLKPLALKDVCNAAPAREKLLNKGVTLRYAYADKSGGAIVSFDLQQADCPAARP
jgi:hypothetical protein